MRDIDDLMEMWLYAELILEKESLRAVSLSPSGGGGVNAQSNSEWAMTFRKYATDREAKLFNHRAPGWMWKIFGERVPDSVYERGLRLLDIL